MQRKRQPELTLDQEKRKRWTTFSTGGNRPAIIPARGVVSELLPGCLRLGLVSCAYLE